MIRRGNTEIIENKGIVPRSKEGRMDIMSNRVALNNDIRLDVIQLLHDIAWAQNMSDEESYIKCFTPGAIVDYTGPHGEDKLLTPTDAAAWLADRTNNRGPSAHRISNISMRAEPDHIAVRSYFDVSLLPRDESEQLKLAYGRYFDEAVPTADGVKLRSRRAECDARISVTPSLITFL